MSSPANKLTGQILSFLFEQGAFAWRASSTGIFDAQKGTYRTAPKKGVSDVLCCYQGKLIAIEVKVGKDRLSPEQTGFIKNVLHAGGLTFVVTNFEAFKKQWQEVIHNSRP